MDRTYQDNAPLKGIRVLDLTHVVAGPYATRYLAMLGAEIIKIENPKTNGDMTRHTGPMADDCSVRFCSLNHNKSSMLLDLSVPQGKEIFLQLVAKSHIVVDNFRPGVLDKLGIGFQEMQQSNPKIVYGNLSGFGTEGAYRDLPAYDIIAQAMSGMMMLNGEEGTPPMKVGTSMADIISGLNLVIGVLAALRKADLTGRGCFVETNLVDSLVSSLMMEYVGYLFHGIPPKRTGNNYREWCPSGTYQAKDGYYVLAVGREEEFKRLALQVLERPHLAQDPQYATHSLRVQNRDAINEAIYEWGKDLTVEEVCLTLRQAAIPCAPVLNIPEVVSNEHIHHNRQMFLTYDQPEAGQITVTNIPVRFHDTAQILPQEAPWLGKDTKHILLDILALNKEEILSLEKCGAITKTNIS